MLAFDRRVFLFLKGLTSTLEVKRSVSSLVAGWFILLGAVFLLHMEANGIHIRDGEPLRESFYSVEAMWRAVHGQQAGHDYISLSSPLLHSIWNLTASIAGARPDLERFFLPLIAALFIPMVFRQAVRRMADGEAFILVATLTLLALGAKPLAGGPFDFSFPGYQAALSLLLLLPVTLTLFPTIKPEQSRRGGREWLDAGYTGVAAGTVVLLDTGSGIAALLALSSAALFMAGRDRILAIRALSICVGMTATVAALSYDLHAVWIATTIDVAMNTGLTVIAAGKFASFYEHVPGMTVAALAGLWALEQYRKCDTDSRELRRAVAGAIAILLASFLAMQKAPNDLPVLLLILLLYIHRSFCTVPVVVTSIPDETYRVLRYIATAAPFLVFASALIAIQAVNVAVHTADSARAPLEYWQSSADGASALKPAAATVEAPGVRHVGYAAAIVEAMTLVREHGRETSRVLLFDDANPLPYLLQAEPPRTLLSSNVAGIAAGVSKPAASLFFGNAETLVIPRERLFGATADMLSDLYGDAIVKCFSQATGSKHFSIWLRQPSCDFASLAEEPRSTP